MERDDVWELYDESYAEAYDARFLLDAWPKAGLDFEVGVLRRFVEEPGVSWLDAGCGTGHVLSLFPDVDRAGMDLSPAMLEQATKANPTARYLRQGDFRVDVEEWHGAWDVVSCMWSAYQYVESMPEIDVVFTNFAGWVAPGGTLFVPMSDLEDLRYVDIAYEEDPDVWGGTIALTGVTWNWAEDGTGKFHRHLVAPHAGHLVRLLEPYFEKVEVLRYPPFFPGGISRKAILATGRRAEGEEGTAEVVWHEAPRHPEDLAEEARANREAELVASWEQRIDALEADLNGVKAELTDARNRLEAVQGKVESVAEHVVRSNDQGEYYDVVGVIHDQVGGIREDLDALAQRLFPPEAEGEAEAAAKPRKGRLRGKIANVIDPD
ncbi:MAG: methyltransferase domain-containing protein [Actinobacteria bacterium]|nr:methyltransferase domain-containing protein [Actinomycetota bacterium]